MDLTRHARADSLDPAQILFGGALQLLDGSEIRRQQRGGRLADLGNAKRVQEMPQLGPAARCDTVEQVLGRLVGESIQLHELILAQPVEVARVFDCASLDELRECRVAKSLDVYDRGVMPQPLEPLSAAEGIDAAMRDVWLLAHDIAPAHGTIRGHLPAWFGLLDADDLRDHVSGAMDRHARADVNAFLVDLRLVVHGHVADRDPAYNHRLHVRDGSKHASAADVTRDLLDHGLRLLRCVLERDRPARRPCDET